MNIFVPVQFSIPQNNENQNERENRMVRLTRINLRRKLNIFDLPTAKFIKNFRVSKDTFKSLLQLLDLPVGIRSTRLHPVLQLAVTLNFLGGGGYQRQVGADWVAPIGQSTVCKICDHKKRVLAINAKYGGSAHDSFVWRQSAQREKLNNEYCVGTSSSSWLLGDSGYPLEPFLITPYRSVTEHSPESRFNNIHSQARSIVERCIGVIKTRWRCVLEERKLRYSPKRAAQIINLCAALHNICVENREPVPEGITGGASVGGSGNAETPTQNNASEGARIRNGIRDALWTNPPRHHSSTTIGINP